MQEDKNHERDEDDRLDKRMDNSLDGGLHRRRCVIDDLVVHVGGEQRFRLVQRLVDRFGGLELVCARQQINGHRAGRLAVEPSKGVVVLRAQLGAPDVLHADLRAGFSLTENDVLKLLGVDEPAGGAHRIGKFLVFR